MSNFQRIVDAGPDVVRIYFDFVSGPTRTTRLGSVAFDRLTANFSVEWSVDGRASLSIAKRIELVFWSLRLVRDIVK